jgi:ADP-heptose:LPS heptosyltransferase
MSSEGQVAHAPRLLLVLMGSLGDVTRGLYLVDAIKASIPQARITWLVEPACEAVVRLHPHIDDIIVFQRRAGVRGILGLRQELRKRQFDVTLDLQRHAKSGLFSWLSRAPRRIGFSRSDAKEGNWFFNTEHIPARGELISKIEHYLLFLDALKVPRPSVLSSGLRDVKLAEPRDWEPALSGGYIGLVLGSSWDSKDWPEEGYNVLIDSLLAEGQEKIVLIGDRTKVDMASRLLEVARRKEGIVNLVGRTTLRDLVVVLKGARLCIGPDSGPGHLCGAVGTPHVTLFGPTPVVRNVPQGSDQLALTSAVGCAPCKRRVCPGLGKVCMKLISPQAVLAMVHEIRLQRPGNYSA